MPLKIPPLTPVPIQPTAAEPFSTFVKNLPSALTPLTGSELVPIIQNGASKHVPPNTIGFGPPSALAPATANIVVYISQIGSDSNPGTVTQPFATFNHAFSYVSGFDYKNLYYPTINIANGTYREVDLIVPALLHVGTTPFFFNMGLLVGNITAPQNVLVSPAAGTSSVGAVFNLFDGAQWGFDGLSIECGNITNFCEPFQVYNSLLVTTLVGDPVPALRIGNPGQGGGSMFDAENNAVVSVANVSIYATSADAIESGFAGAQVNVGVGNTIQGGFENNCTFNAALFVLIGGCFSNIPANQLMTNGHTITGQQFQLSQSSELIRGDPIPGSLGSCDGSSAFNGVFGNNITTQTSNYTLGYSGGASFDIVEMNLAGANTVTVPTDATAGFPIGTKIQITQIGAGTTTIVASGGVTVHNVGALSGQWGSVTLYKRATNEWVQTII